MPKVIIDGKEFIATCIGCDRLLDKEEVVNLTKEIGNESMQICFFCLKKVLDAKITSYKNKGN